MARFFKKAFFALILIPLWVAADTPDESTLALSLRTLNYFLTAAECLSIKASEHEKEEFLTARIMGLQWDINSGQIMSEEWISEYIAAEDKDRAEIYEAVNRYCPRAASSIVASVSADGFSSSSLPVEILAGVVIKAISIDILSKGDLKIIFEHENEALGLTDIY